jgi:bacteriorhodopsin
MGVLQRSNDALNINPPPAADQFLLEHGSDWLWAVAAVYAISFVG